MKTRKGNKEHTRIPKMTNGFVKYVSNVCQINTYRTTII